MEEAHGRRSDRSVGASSGWNVGPGEIFLALPCLAGNHQARKPTELTKANAGDDKDEQTGGPDLTAFEREIFSRPPEA